MFEKNFHIGCSPSSLQILLANRGGKRVFKHMTSTRRNHVASTSVRRQSDVMRLLGDEVRDLQIKR